MHDIRKIREHPKDFDAGLKRRGLSPLSGELLVLDQERRALETRAQDISNERNKAAKAIGLRKAAGEDASELIEQAARSKAAQAQAETEAKEKTDALNAALCIIPNIPDLDTPDGADENDNVEVKTWGTPRDFAFKPKDHVDLGEGLGLMNFEVAAKMSGARFVVLMGALARLERALANFMLDVQTGENGYTEVNPPALVKDTALYGTGQLPKFAEDLFHTEDDYWLIPTAEVPLTNIVAGAILKADDLPRRYSAQTWCFRSEAGAAGKDTRGMIRQHQFTKVEMVSVTKPEESDAELARMTRCAEGILEKLDLPYRTVALCAGDLGFAAVKTYDLEVWLPAQNTYREISSCSNTRDFQARRMNARFKRDERKKPEFVNTLNGSGLAAGRCLVAVLENYQNEDGSVRVPEALRPYMGGLEVIGGAA